jgi:nitroimidazol reductase NimA-like FMN-containing flavoprotein (pyridoxamine 5'-phosphate oxidase superfamily)
MTTTRAASFSNLNRAECDAILSRNSVGRIAFALDDRIAITPVQYVHDDEWIYVRATPDTDVSVLEHQPLTFEVDEFESVLDWRSVVVRGSVQLLSDASDAADEEDYGRAILMLQELLPESLVEADAVSFGSVVRLHADEVTGRAARVRR